MNATTHYTRRQQRTIYMTTFPPPPSLQRPLPCHRAPPARHCPAAGGPLPHRRWRGVLLLRPSTHSSGPRSRPGGSCTRSGRAGRLSPARWTVDFIYGEVAKRGCSSHTPGGWRRRRCRRRRRHRRRGWHRQQLRELETAQQLPELETTSPPPSHDLGGKRKEEN